MKSHWFSFCIFLCMVSLSAQSTQTNTVSLCDLAANPNKYTGTMVSIRASILKGWLKPGKPLRKLVLVEPDASVVCPSVRVEAIIPEATKPKPAFNLERDAAFNALARALHERTAIEGVFEGRFDYKTGGKDHLRLVIRRVSDLDIQETGHIDR